MTDERIKYKTSQEGGEVFIPSGWYNMEDIQDILAEMIVNTIDFEDAVEQMNNMIEDQE